MKIKNKSLFLLLILLGLFMRLYRINIPLLEFYPSRQVQTAEITRNYYLFGLNVTRPRVSYFGPGLTHFLVEFPGYNLVIALAYKLLGSADERIGRVFSIVGWLASAYLLFEIARKYIGDNAALFTLFFYTFSPLLILISRRFQPDQWMLTLS